MGGLYDAATLHAHLNKTKILEYNMKTTLSGEKHSCYQNNTRKTTNRKNASNPHKCWMQEKACHPHGTNKPFPNVWPAALSAPVRESAPSSFPSLNCKVAARCRLGRAATSQFREGKEEGGGRAASQTPTQLPPSPQIKAFNSHVTSLT